MRPIHCLLLPAARELGPRRAPRVRQCPFSRLAFSARRTRSPRSRVCSWTVAQAPERALADPRCPTRSQLPGRRKEQAVDRSHSSLTQDQAPPEAPSIRAPLLRELVGYLRENRTQLREEWVRRITDAQLLRVMTPAEIFSEVTAVYDNYVNALETGSVETLQAYARDLSERIIPRGVETHEVLGIVLLLRDVLARS